MTYSRPDTLGAPADGRRCGRLSPNRRLPRPNCESSRIELNGIALSSSGGPQDAGGQSLLCLGGALFSRERGDSSLEHGAQHRNSFWIVRSNRGCPNHTPVSPSSLRPARHPALHDPFGPFPPACRASLFVTSRNSLSERSTSHIEADAGTRCATRIAEQVGGASKVPGLGGRNRTGLTERVFSGTEFWPGCQK